MTADGAARDDDDAMKAVEEAARAARDTVADLASVPDERLDAALRAIADALGRQAAPVLAANEAGHDARAARPASAAACSTGSGWTRPGSRPSRASSARWPRSPTNRPNG